MKTSSFVRSIVAVIAVIPCLAAANCNSRFVAQARALDHIADSIGGEHREHVGYGRVCSADQNFLSAIHTVQGLTDRLHSAAENGAEGASLERIFCAIKRAAGCMRQSAGGVRLCPSTRELMGDFSRTMAAMEGSDAFYASREPEYLQDYAFRDNRSRSSRHER